MKFSGKQLFEMFIEEFEKVPDAPKDSPSWETIMIPATRVAYDALAEKLNAMLLSARWQAVINEQMRQAKVPDMIINEEAMRRCHFPPPAICFCYSCLETARAKHSATHTRSCREKMEKGEACSC